jgi:pimeloyl-ACP methyl ester carboxylesterase
MALATMLRHAKLHPDDDPLFRFAIFFSIPCLPDKDPNGRSEEWGKIRVQSLHVCGEADELWFESSKVVAEKNCEKGSTTVIVHKGGHLIPKDKPTVDRILNAIEDLLDRTDSM